jgi:hypothetical protein
MAVETLGEALSYRWRVTARCAASKQDGMQIFSSSRSGIRFEVVN